MNIGDKIPEVLGFDASRREVKASDFAGKKLVIYFYPKDNTPGCTAQSLRRQCRIWRTAQGGL